MRLTKNDMARVIVQALFGLDELPAASNCNVETMVKYHKIQWFREWYPTAIKVLQDRTANK